MDAQQALRANGRAPAVNSSGAKVYQPATSASAPAHSSAAAAAAAAARSSPSSVSSGNGNGNGAGAGDDGNRHVCPQEGCNRSYARREHLKRHMKIHNGAEPASCRICGRRFYRKDHLKHHELAHTDDRPYVCAEAGCGRTYRQRCSLSQHQRTTGHSGRVDRSAKERQEAKAAAAAAAATQRAAASAAVDRARAASGDYSTASPLRYAPPASSAPSALRAPPAQQHHQPQHGAAYASPLAIRRPDQLHSALRLPTSYAVPYSVSSEFGYAPTPPSSRPYGRGSGAPALQNESPMMDASSDFDCFEDQQRALGGPSHWQSLNMSSYDAAPPASSSNTDFAALTRSLGGRDALASLISDTQAHHMSHHGDDDDSAMGGSNTTTINALLRELINPAAASSASGQQHARGKSESSDGSEPHHDDNYGAHDGHNAAAFRHAARPGMSGPSMVDKLNALL